MNYYGQQRNVTMINELPDLEDLEGVGIHPTERPVIPGDNYQKFIRGQHRLDPEAGMDHMGPSMYRSQLMYGPPEPYSNHATLGQPPGDMIIHSPLMQTISPQPDYMSYNCIDISKHVHDCPICSKFYNDDKTLYIIVIVILVIVCLLLLKRVLDV